jgi:predicted MPP superfamily phosphohydrolase
LLTRILFMLGFLAIVNAYTAARLISRWPWAQQHLLVSWLFVLGFFILQLAAPIGNRLLFSNLGPSFAPAVTTLNWVSYLAFGMMSLLIVYTFVADVVTLAWNFASTPADPAAFDRHTLAVILAAVLATTALGLWQATGAPKIYKVDIPIQNLPASFDGFTIAQISDLHIGPTIKRVYAQRVVDAVNNLKPDMIAMTGDMADGHPSEMTQDLAPLADLRARDGVYYAIGNHEHYWREQDWLAAFKSMNAQTLANQHDVIRRGQDMLVVAGVLDYSMGAASDPQRAIAGAPEKAVKILLAHQPASCTRAAKAGFDLQLSGHTHGGQYFPFTYLIRYFQKYYDGLNKCDGMWVYVNHGTGYWGPPLRALMPPEITLITLRKKN